MPAMGLLVLLILGWSASPCVGHPTYITAAHAVVQADGTCRITIGFDTLAYALNDTSARIGNDAMEALLAAPREEVERILRDARGRFERGFAIVTEGGEVAPATLSFPTADDLTHWRASTDAVLPAVLPVEVTVRLPAGTKTVAFRFPGLLAETILTVERPGEDFFTEPVEGGKLSTSLPLRFAAPTPPANPSAAGNRNEQMNPSPRRPQP